MLDGKHQFYHHYLLSVNFFFFLSDSLPEEGIKHENDALIYLVPSGSSVGDSEWFWNRIPW